MLFFMHIQIDYKFNKYINNLMTELYERAWKSIISPKQFTHNFSHFCPKKQNLNGQVLQRIDFTVRNQQGKRISAVLLKDQIIQPEHTILYFHGNGGSKLQCLSFIPFICHLRLAVISFDFVGCGNSDNGYLTYGINEANDAEEVLRQADRYYNRQKLTVWGRSMGAVTAMIFSQKNSSILSNVVLDSPFRNLGVTVKKIMKRQTNMPDGLIDVVGYFLKKEVNKKVGINLFDVDNLEGFKKISRDLSILFLYSQNDLIVAKEEIFLFYKNFKGGKELMQIEEKHEEERSQRVFSNALEWIMKGNIKKKKSKLQLSCFCASTLEKNSIKEVSFKNEKTLSK